MERYGVLENNWIVPTSKETGLPVVETEPPDLEHGFKAVARYEQQGDQIVKIWDVVPWTEQDWKRPEEAVVENEGDSND